MPYFNKFPKFFYSTSSETAKFKAVTNIFANIRFLREALLNSDLYYNYDVKDGERPEDISNKLYKDPEKHWVILLANEILDPQFDWVMEQSSLERYITQKYSSFNLQLPASDQYSSNYISNEVVYQGNSIVDANAVAQVASFNASSKILQIKFANQSISNGQPIIGNSSKENHTILSITSNEDGKTWALNTTSHYEVTETRYNSYDKVKNTVSYSVSTLDYNHVNDTVIPMTIGYSNTTSNLVDGTKLYIERYVAPKSYYDVEVDKNESKRKIRLPKPEHIIEIEQQFERLMRKA